MKREDDTLPRMSARRYSAIDNFFGTVDTALRVIGGDSQALRKPPTRNEECALTESERHTAAELMRINRAGEIAAQALYQGQALTATNASIRETLHRAAREEIDHLAWTSQRLRELNAHRSYLDPLWYAGSFAIGAVAGLAGDKWSLGFVAETERQVSEHLSGHLAKLPAADVKSRAILNQMLADETAHATAAVRAGGRELPYPIRATMRAMARIMTTLARWI